MIIYGVRTSLSVAMVAMVNSTEETSLNATENFVACSNLLSNGVNERNLEFQGVKYDWDSTTQGLIFTSFNYGYLATLLLGGVLSEKFGTKWLFGISILMTSCLYLLIPIAASWGSAAFIAIRVLAGITEGVTLPTINLAMSNWSPTSERSRILSIINSGIPAAVVISMPLSGFLGFALCLIAVTQSGCRPELIIGFLCLAMFLSGLVYPGYKVAHIDMSPNHSGVLCGISTTVALLGGSFSPTIAGWLTESGDTLENWNKIFYITCAIYIASGVFFVIFGSAELQSWDAGKTDIVTDSKIENNPSSEEFQERQ
ncbi:Sialin [Araneus ventricosus]|uniref:Sialin n=1 Tax=Araneus ventricosus TaxID=182803 RepID=A0A4Y2GWY2_ARAVE|nr:Sialin [Araneus ventricosus]